MKPIYCEGEDFSSTFSKLLSKHGLSCYKVHQFTGIDQAYLSRLRNGQKEDPRPRTLYLIGLALVHYIPQLQLEEVEELLHSAGRYLQHY